MVVCIIVVVYLIYLGSNSSSQGATSPTYSACRLAQEHNATARKKQATEDFVWRAMGEAT